MKNAILRLSALLTAVCLLAGIPLANAADGYDYAYTYTYDYWADLRYSPDAYRVKDFLTSASLKLDKPMVNPQGLFVRGNDIYICDTGNNRILQLTCADDQYTLTRCITEIKGDVSPKTFSGPSDIYVDADGMLYIADTNNNRVVKVDQELNYQLSFVKPTDPTYDQTKSFLPAKLVADVSGRVFCLATNVNMGLMKFEANGTFTGFIGAAPVKYSWYELIWRMLSTKEQRAQQASLVSTEYDNIAIDKKGFFYVVTQTFDVNELKSGAAEPIRRLNSLGTNILIENGTYPPIGDIQWAGGNENLSRSGPSLFVDITVLDNDVYIALDEKHNRLFGYDHQGNMLWAFGGVGNAMGYFNMPTALEHMGYDLLILDSQAAALTIMTPTEYGRLIYKATEEYSSGLYDESADTWLEVLKRNGNCDLAYIGIGRAELQRGNYEKACEYFKMARDEDNYSEAFRYYRSDLVEQNIGWIFGLVAIVLVVPAVIGFVKKLREEVENS